MAPHGAADLAFGANRFILLNLMYSDLELSLNKKALCTFAADEFWSVPRKV